MIKIEMRMELRIDGRVQVYVRIEGPTAEHNAEHDLDYISAGVDDALEQLPVEVSKFMSEFDENDCEIED